MELAPFNIQATVYEKIKAEILFINFLPSFDHAEESWRNEVSRNDNSIPSFRMFSFDNIAQVGKQSTEYHTAIDTYRRSDGHQAWNMILEVIYDCKWCVRFRQ